MQAAVAVRRRRPAKPSSKVATAGLAGAASVMLIWILGQMSIRVPAEVGSAMTTLLSFAAGYVKKG